jgi:crcB protein
MAELGWMAAGGCAGAIARYAVSAFVAARWPTKLPIGTLLVNVIGSFLLGLIAGGGLDERLAFFLGTGFLGAFTTFSTFKLESVQLFRRGEAAFGRLYMALSYVPGIGAAWLGYMLGGYWW